MADTDSGDLKATRGTDTADRRGLLPIPSDIARWRHDVRTHLNIIGGFAHLLTSSGDLPSDKQEFVRYIQSASKSIEGLLDLMRDEFYPPTGPTRSHVRLDD